MARTITSANSIFILTVPGVFDSGVRIQDFATDDAFDIDGVANAEFRIGVDGNSAAGKVFAPKKMKVRLEANSRSLAAFEDWNRAEETLRDVIMASATITIPSIGKTYNLTDGAMTMFKPMPDVKKTLGAPEFEITWGRVESANI